ncbi:hypothetical protein GCM10020256_29050 [Streptomyces thermocoprophilus]
MLRHEFRPGRLVAGLSLTAAGVAYAGDAGGLWDMPWFALIPMVVGGPVPGRRGGNDRARRPQLPVGARYGPRERHGSRPRRAA